MPETPTPAPVELAAFNRVVKVLYFTLLATVGVYWTVLELLAANIEPRDLGLVKTALLVAAAGTVGGVLSLRFGRLRPLLAEAGSELTARLAQARTYYILCFALSESVALYGFVLRFLGASRAEAAPFFVAAVGLFLLCYPQTPRIPGSPGYG